ncbi:olfactory receptor 8G17-like [Aquarana catesbeiana]|uniref:olfactory receptor 8G17-like n=1 Tax=Aquarana catesbeiana TaxID=8400 RepID=UPI003CC9B5F6
MENQTILNEFFLSGLSDLPALQLPLFFFSFLIYLLTLFCNLLIISLTVTNSRLHVPMYFFLGNLAGLDLCSSSVIVPRMLFDLHTKSRKITITACMTQVFFFIFLVSSETILLSVMSYDRYIAICQPLHYIEIMKWKMCLQLVSSVWCLGFTYSLVHTIYAFKLTFCESDIIESFFCDLPQLFFISCSDIYVNILLIFFVGGLLGAGTLVMTFFPYVYIFKTVLKIKVKGNRSKVFSTCTPHLTVVIIYYGSIFFNYFQPNASHQFSGNKVVSMFYTMILPLLNPLIYSLRNQDFRTAFQNVLMKIIPNAIYSKFHLS